MVLLRPTTRDKEGNRLSLSYFKLTNPLRFVEAGVGRGQGRYDHALKPRPWFLQTRCADVSRGACFPLEPRACSRPASASVFPVCSAPAEFRASVSSVLGKAGHSKTRLGEFVFSDRFVSTRRGVLSVTNGAASRPSCDCYLLPLGISGVEGFYSMSRAGRVQS